MKRIRFAEDVEEEQPARPASAGRRRFWAWHPAGARSTLALVSNPNKPSPQQLEDFLVEIRNGKTRQEAAIEVGGTGTMFRTFINGKGEESLAFAERYVQALEEAGNAPSPYAARIRELEGVHLVHRMLDEAIVRALDPEKGRVGASNRVLHNLLLLKADDFKPLLEARTRHIHEGQVGIYALPQIDTGKWSLEEHEEFVKLEERRNALIAKAQPDVDLVGRPKAALNAGDDVVEDAEFTEVDADAA